MNRLNEELRRIRELSNYNPSSTHTKNKKEVRTNGTIIETKQGANNKIYAIVCECSNFFIKECKDVKKQNLTEGYDYIGGLKNKLDYCYSTLDEAKENLYFKLHSINESVNKENRVTLNPKKYTSAFNTKESLDMRKMLNLYEEKQNNFSKKQEFGDHPRFQKPTMDVKGPKAKPYARKVGSSLPFDLEMDEDDLINYMAESIVRHLSTLEKKK